MSDNSSSQVQLSSYYHGYETFYSSIHVTRALEISNEHGGWHVLVEVYRERWLSEWEPKKKKN